jgi:hypothetical protein
MIYPHVHGSQAFRWLRQEVQQNAGLPVIVDRFFKLVSTFHRCWLLLTA